MVTWRGVGCGVRWPEGGVERVWVGSVTERTRVEKKERKTRRTIMDGAGAVDTGMHAMEGDGACKQSISALRKKKKLTTKRKAWQVGE